jgi:hypothetical protein
MELVHPHFNLCVEMGACQPKPGKALLENQNGLVGCFYFRGLHRGVPAGKGPEEETADSFSVLMGCVKRQPSGAIPDYMGYMTSLIAQSAGAVGNIPLWQRINSHARPTAIRMPGAIPPIYPREQPMLG